MKKRVISIVISIVIFIVMLLLILGKIIDYKKKEAVAAYDGKWKVTHQLTTYFRATSNFFPHHYLGRTIILSENSMERSVGEWPEPLGWIKFQYDYSEVIPYSSEDKWFELNTFWSIDKFADMERVRFLRYWDKIYDGSYYCVDYFVILDETHLAYGYIGGYYLLERFQYCDPMVSEKDLNGTWKIAYLDSYENSYEGSYEEIEKEAPRSSLKGTDFNVEDWLGKSVTVSENEVRISETGYQTAGIESGKIRREDFEQKMDIHDGLSIYDDEILVCNIKCQNGEDIICVPVNENQMIMRIEEGWFMLEKE